MPCPQRRATTEYPKHPTTGSRAVTATHLVALIWAGARFENGHLVERPEEPVAA